MNTNYSDLIIYFWWNDTAVTTQSAVRNLLKFPKQTSKACSYNKVWLCIYLKTLVPIMCNPLATIIVEIFLKASIHIKAYYIYMAPSGKVFFQHLLWQFGDIFWTGRRVNQGCSQLWRLLVRTKSLSVFLITRVVNYELHDSDRPCIFLERKLSPVFSSKNNEEQPPTRQGVDATTEYQLCNLRLWDFALNKHLLTENIIKQKSASHGRQDFCTW